MIEFTRHDILRKRRIGHVTQHLPANHTKGGHTIIGQAHNPDKGILCRIRFNRVEDIGFHPNELISFGDVWMHVSYLRWMMMEIHAWDAARRRDKLTHAYPNADWIVAAHARATKRIIAELRSNQDIPVDRSDRRFTHTIDELIAEYSTGGHLCKTWGKGYAPAKHTRI